MGSTLLRMTRQSAADVGESLKKSYKRTSENSRPLASYNVLAGPISISLFPLDERPHDQPNLSNHCSKLITGVVVTNKNTWKEFEIGSPMEDSYRRTDIARHQIRLLHH